MARGGRKQQQEPEEYEVERIESHQIEYEGKQKKPVLKYFIKWRNYSSKENTWEPSVAVENAEELVDEYWVTKGGQQKRDEVCNIINNFKSSKGDRTTKTSSSQKRRKDEKTTPSKRAKRFEPESDEENQVVETAEPYESEDEADYSDSDIEDENFRANSNWSDVSKVECVRSGDSTKELYAIVRWSDGKLARYKTSFISNKNPMILIRYYEKRLSFEKNK